MLTIARESRAALRIAQLSISLILRSTARAM